MEATILGLYRPPFKKAGYFEAIPFIPAKKQAPNCVGGIF